MHATPHLVTGPALLQGGLGDHLHREGLVAVHALGPVALGESALQTHTKDRRGGPRAG